MSSANNKVKSDKRKLSKSTADSAKKSKVTSSQLGSYPINLSSLDDTVVSALCSAADAVAAVKAFDAGTGLDNKEAAATATVAATQAESACDAAREATFPFLEDSNTASYASHASAYAAASLLYAEALLLQHELQTAAERQEAGSGKTKKSGKGKKANSKAPSNAEAVGKAALRALDLAMLRGGVNDWAPHAAPLVQSATALLGEPATSDAPKSTPVAHDPLTAATADAADADAVAAANTAAEARCPQWLCGEADAHCTRIERVDARTLTPESFAALYMGAGTSDGSGNNNRSLPKPVVLTHALEAWPALKRWPDMAYLRRAAGVSDRLVPVETCSDADASQTYMSDSWQQRVMSFGDYIDKYMVPSPISMEGAARGAFGDEDDDGSVDADDDDDDDADDDEEEEEDDFEDDYEDDDDEARGYLAQHPLFDQVPSLRNDIVEPSLCAAVCPEDLKAPANCEVRLSKKTTASIVNSVAVGKAASSASKTATDNNKKADKEKEGQEEVMGPLVSAWFGPSGTVSPLHNDPYHNLLCQVVGRKYLRLVDARHTKHVYPRAGALCNNSQVNVDAPDNKSFPLFAKAPCWQTVLGPGECLYIPRHAWHYVRSLEPSFSVSFWWGAKMGLAQGTGDDDEYHAVY